MPPSIKEAAEQACSESGQTSNKENGYCTYVR